MSLRFFLNISIRLDILFMLQTPLDHTRFFIIDRRTAAITPLTRQFDLKDGIERIRVVVVVIQIFRCLQHFPSRLVSGSRRIMQ